jgi:serine protease Do
MKAGAFWIFILSLVLASSFLSAGSESSLRLYPFPVAELKKILSDWLIDSGFEVSQTSHEPDKIRLKALKGCESWEMILKPYSTLASYLLAAYTINGQPDQNKLNDLWAYLESYSQDFSQERKNVKRKTPMISSAVLNQAGSVVCIKARVKDEPVQFSGFIIDRKGLIISTAHDLEGVQEITVNLDNGQELTGHLVKKDTYRDLTLITINSEADSSISLKKGRNSMRIGEKVYAIGCPLNHKGKLESGIIDGPMRWVDNLPLWQANMETLPGSSGSPVFDAKGNLVGVVKGRYRGTDSKGFFIPLRTVLEFLREE